MRTSVVIASGASLTDEQVAWVYNSDKVDNVIAVSNVGLTKAPWADALVSYDTAWWQTHLEHVYFKGRKFSSKPYERVEHFDMKKRGVGGFINSGLFGMYVARDIYKAEKIVLLGFDMHRRNGQHFFGEHTRIYNGRPLHNTDEKLFKIHIKQFERFYGSDVVNCTPDSDLNFFPKAELSDII